MHAMKKVKCVETLNFTFLPVGGSKWFTKESRSTHRVHIIQWYDVRVFFFSFYCNNLMKFVKMYAFLLYKHTFVKRFWIFFNAFA